MRTILRCALVLFAFFLSFGSAEGKPVHVLSGRDPVSLVPTVDDFLPPSPDIKADGRDDFVTVRGKEGVDITFSLDPGTMSGEVMDWWCVVFRNDIASGSLVPMAITPIGRFPLVDMPQTHVCDLSLDPGIYVCMFLLGPTPDTNLEMAWYDYVVIQWEL